MSASPQSFYLFDFDKNIMRVRVPFVLVDEEDGTEIELPARQYMHVRDQLGKLDPWKSFSDRDALRYYRDVPGVPPEDQPFVHQIRDAVSSGDERAWQAPSWGMFVHACEEGKPFSLITARGHSEETTKAGFAVLKEHGYISREPNYLTIFNVSDEGVRRSLGDEALDAGVEELKRRAILHTVDRAVELFGRERHHFGMSDDTMTNVQFIADAMCECKKKYPEMRFFAISTNGRHLLKAEIFPLNVPVPGHGDPNGAEPLHSHLEA